MIDIKQSLAHTTWNCKYHIVFAPKRAKVSEKSILQRKKKRSRKNPEDTLRMEEGEDPRSGGMP